MSIRTVVTRGYGSFGTIPKVVTRGYSIGAAITPVVPTPSTAFVGGGSYRFYTPSDSLPGKKKKKRIDEVIAQEAQVKAQIEEYQDTGADLSILERLLERLKELQLIILRLALESDAAARYIEMKRQEEEDEDVLFISRYL